MMEWSNEQCLELIDLYEKHPVLWNTKHSYYYSKTKKQLAWDSVAHALQVDVKTVRRKMQSLLGSFRSQKSKGRRLIKGETGINDIYESKWFAFKRMQFLFDRDEPQGIPHTEDDTLNTIKNEYLAEEIECDVSADFHTELHTKFMEQSDEENTTNLHEIGPIKRKREIEDARTDVVPAFVEDPRYNTITNDRFGTYGQHVANKLRLYSARTQAIVEHMINNVLFEADMGNYDSTGFGKYQSPQHNPNHTQSLTSANSESRTATSTPSITD